MTENKYVDDNGQLKAEVTPDELEGAAGGVGSDIAATVTPMLADYASPDKPKE